MEPVEIRFVAVDSVTPAISSISRRVENLWENNAQRIKEIKRREAAQIEQIQQKQVRTGKNLSHQIESIQKRTSERIVSLKEREAIRVRQIANRSASEQKRSIEGILSVVERSSLGSAIGQFGGMSAGGVAAGLGATAIVAGAGLFIAGVSKTFDVIVGGLRHVASQFADAVVEIGGGFSVQQTVTNAAKNQRSAMTVAASSGGAFSDTEVSRMASGLSANSEFRAGELINALGEFQSFTGGEDLKKAFESGTIEFGQKLASIYQMDPSQVLGLAGQVQTSTGLQGKELQDLLGVLIGQGAAGAIEFTDIPAMSKAFAKSSLYSGEGGKLGVLSEIGAIGQLSRGVFGSSEEAATGVNALLTNIATNKQTQLKFGAKTEGGKISNLTDVLGNMAKQVAVKGGTALTGLDSRAQTAVLGLVSKAQEAAGPGATPEQVAKALQEEIDSLKKVAETREAVEKKFQKVSESIEFRLKKMFGGMEESLSGMSIDFIETEVIPKLKALGEALSDEKTQANIKEFFNSAADAAKAFADVLLETAPFFISALFTFIDALLAAGEILPGETGKSFGRARESARKTEVSLNKNVNAARAIMGKDPVELDAYGRSSTGEAGKATTDVGLNLIKSGVLGTLGPLGSLLDMATGSGQPQAAELGSQIANSIKGIKIEAPASNVTVTVLDDSGNEKKSKIEVENTNKAGFRG